MNEFKLVGKKRCMSQIFVEDGSCVPVTVIEIADNVVVQLKTASKDGYNAIQLAAFETSFNRLNGPMKSKFQKVEQKAYRSLHEVRVDDSSQFELGQAFSISPIDSSFTVNVSAASKGKGTQGVIKRWGKAGGPAAHGSRFHRAPGSIGQCTWPGKVFKNMKLPGQMGNKKVTVKKLKVMKVNQEKGLIFVKGAVPGHNGAEVVVNVAYNDYMSKLENAA